MMTRSSARCPDEGSATKTLRETPICGAASPTPDTAYIVSIMSSMSVWISGVTLSTGWAVRRSTSSPYFAIGRIMTRILVRSG